METKIIAHLKVWHRFLLILFLVTGSVLITTTADAHQDGCHRWHSCPSDTGNYACGDLGYPCDRACRPEEEAKINSNPYISESLRLLKIAQVRTNCPAPSPIPTPTYSFSLPSFTYRYYSTVTPTPVPTRIPTPTATPQVINKSKFSEKQLPVVVKKVFVSVYKRNPTSTEIEYWKKRLRTDKTTEVLLKSTMQWQKMKGIKR